MCALPTGTVTFLFTDIEGSTNLWEQYPQAMQSALAKHDRILTQAVQANRGQVVKTTGDGVHAVFETAVNGLAAAFEAQQALQGERWEEISPQTVRVRMGLHTGEAEVRAGDYYGSALNRAARLMAAGYGGQILISNITAELVREGLPDGANLRDLGEHCLKDIERPEHIYQIVYPNLPSDFPAIKTLQSIPNNLPAQLSSFVGREKEIAEITDLLNTARLVTLTGPGGTGKTRLSQEVSAQVLLTFPQGVWFIELAPLADPSQIIPTLAQVFGLKELPATPLAALIVEYLRDKKGLLILDNCEHLIEACARLVDDLLHQCRRLKIIVSSREALGIAGEVDYRIPPLTEAEAARLFVDRAQAANPKFNRSENNAAAIARICSRLDGIPLAIELAAARTKLLSPEQIAARLDDRFRLLIGGSRTALPRQQTLRALIDWSYDLLAEEEKRLLRIASVFVGGWTLDAIEALAEDTNTVEHLEQLVNKSLVVTKMHGAEMRYFLLETIHQYAREKLFDGGVSEAVRVRNLHLQVFLKRCETAEPQLFGAQMIDALDELEVEQDNLRAALEWALEQEPLAALRMVAVLAYFWCRRASSAEGIAWVKQVLARAETVDVQGEAALAFLAVKAKVLTGEANMAFQLGDNPAARAAIDDAVAIARQIHATQTLAFAMSFGAVVAGFMGDEQQARAWAEESLALSTQYGYLYERASVVGLRGMFLAMLNGQPVPPGSAEEMIQAARASGNPWLLAMAFANVGRTAAAGQDWAKASTSFQDAGTLFYKMRDKIMINDVRSELGHMFRKQGRYAEALAVYRETLPAFHELGHRAAVAHELECLAFIAIAQKQSLQAAKLLGAAEALREHHASIMLPLERIEYDQAVAGLRAQLDEAALTKAWAEGRAMTMNQAVQLALEPVE